MSLALRPFLNRQRSGIHAFTLSVTAVFLYLLYSGAAASPNLDVPYVPTPPDVVNRMLEMAEVQPDDYLIDLGSGDGRIVITAVRDWGVHEALGVDIDPERVAEARDNASQAGIANRAKFKEGDLFETDFSDATVLTMYLLRSVNERLRPTILNELDPGTRVVSHAFDMGDWQPDQSDVINGHKVFLWVVPARVEGSWQLTTQDGEEIPLSLTQEYQNIEARAEINGQTIDLDAEGLRGNEISFTLGADRYVGVVNGDSIEPRPEHDTTADWRAQRI